MIIEFAFANSEDPLHCVQKYLFPAYKCTKGETIIMCSAEQLYTEGL